MDKKKTILFCTESSFVNSGFGVMAKEIISRLQSTNKYNIIELAAYGNPVDPRIEDLPWKYIGVLPNPANPEEIAAYHSQISNQFNVYKFDEVALSTQPDIVVEYRDSWMAMAALNSVYRNNYKLLYMPTLDGFPQKSEWVADYKSADVLCAYTYFGKALIDYHTNNGKQVAAVISPGVDHNVFRPMDKTECRTKMGLQSDIILFGMAARNQPRKKYADLFKAFNLFLKRCKYAGRDDIASKAFLYLHTSSPDVGWDFNAEIKAHQLSHKVLFTYFCKSCGHVFANFYQGDVTFCPRCNQHNSHPPNTSHGVTREQLAIIYNCWDLGIQHTSSEGMGMPVCEMKSCGIPCAMTEYSALAEQAYNGGGIPIPVETYNQENHLSETAQIRACPSNSGAADVMFNYIKSPQEYKDKMSAEARKCILDNYTWDKSAKIWEELIDSIDVPPQEQTWFKPHTPWQPNMQCPNGLNNYQFIEWGFANIIGEPNKKNSAWANKMLQVLDQGFEEVPGPNGQPQRVPVDRNTIVQNMLNSLQHKNSMDLMRYQRLVLKQSQQNAGPVAIEF